MTSEFLPSRRAGTWRLALSRAVGIVLASFALFAGAQEVPPDGPPPPDPVVLFKTTSVAFDRGDFQAAVRASEALLKLIPPDQSPEEKAKSNALLEPIYFTLGAAYFNLKDYPHAIAGLTDYLARYPKSTRAGEATFSLAQANYFNKDYAAAAQGFATLENSPGLREQVLLLEGLSYQEVPDEAKATAALEKLISGGIKSPTEARGAMQLIALYVQRKEPDKALKVLSDVQANIDQLEDVVELNNAALDLGDAYLQNNANKEALICYRAVRTREQVVSLEHARIAALQKRLEANQAAARANPREASRYLLSNQKLQSSAADDQRLVDDFGKLPVIYPKILYRIGRAFSQSGNSWEADVAYQDSYDRATDLVDREAALFGIITACMDVSQTEVARAACNRYLKEFPEGANRFTVGYLLGATALEENDPKDAESYFGRMLADQPDSSLREEMRFLLANALFAQAKYEEAKAQYLRYQKDFPQGAHFEETVYRVALGDVFAGKYDEAFKQLEDFLRKYPASELDSDAQYRDDVCKYALNKYDEVIADAQAWLTQYPTDDKRGEVQALLGDADVATGKTDDALAAYQAASRTATTDEVLDYSLNEAGKILQKRGDWEADAAMFQDFVKAHPDNSSVVMALAQIGRALLKQGKMDEAKHLLADAVNKYIGDRQRASVEQLLDQLAMLCARKKPAAATVGVAAAAPPPPDPGAELDELLGAALADRSPTAEARILYAKAQLARLRRLPAEVERDLLAIASGFKPAVLSATILGQLGDMLLSKGDLVASSSFYQELMNSFPKDDNVDFAYAGMGEIAFENKQYEKALSIFKDSLEQIAPNQKLKDLTVGQGKALLALGKLEEARKIFEQAASVKEWRGETTAFCVYSLGEIEAKKGHWAEANAYYQRVYVAYQRFLPWVAKAYLGSADSLERLGKPQDAVKTYQEMLRNPKLTDFAEATQARERLQVLEAGSTQKSPGA